MIELSRKIAEAEPDDLVVGTYPPLRIGSAVLRKLGTAGGNKGDSSESSVTSGGDKDGDTESSGTAVTEKLLKRGTLLAKSATDGKVTIIGAADAGTDAEAYGILTDDVIVGTEEDVSVNIYIGGKFNLNKIIVSDGYTITEKDKDTLRKYSIEFTAAMKY